MRNEIVRASKASRVCLVIVCLAVLMFAGCQIGEWTCERIDDVSVGVQNTFTAAGKTVALVLVTFCAAIKSLQGDWEEGWGDIKESFGDVKEAFGGSSEAPTEPTGVPHPA